MDAEHKWNDPKIVKDRGLWDFVGLINGDNEHRSDLKLIEIFEFFCQNLMERDRFHLYGHSGGGQFVIRFITYHPELVDRVAASSPGSFLFPRMDQPFPYGFDKNDVEREFGEQVNLDGLRLNRPDLEAKVNALLNLRLFLIVGGEET